MCCLPLFEPTEQEIREWIAAGAVLDDAAPDATRGEAGIWRAIVRDPRGFWIAFRAEEQLLTEIFGSELSVFRH